MQKATILLLEDEKIAAKDLQNKLRALGYSVPAVAFSSEEAIRKAEVIQPDLVLMNIKRQSEPDSIAVAEKLRSRFTIPVAYFAVYSDQRALHHAKQHGADAQGIDSFKNKELQATIEIALHEHHSKNKLEEIRQLLIVRLNKLNDALDVIDQITEVSRVGFIGRRGEEKTGKQATLQMIPEGSELFRQGSRAREIYSIERGLVKLIRQEPDGKEVIGAIRYPGWLLGTSSVILDEPLPMTAVTVTRCHLYRITADVFVNLIKTDADLSWKLHRMMAREAHNQVARLTGIECLSARQRLEEFIWLMVSSMEPGTFDKDVRVQFPAKHFEIAQFLAVTPQYLSWLIGQMEKDRIVTRDRGWLIVSRPEKLWHRSGLQDPSNSGLSANDIVLHQ